MIKSNFNLFYQICGIGKWVLAYIRSAGTSGIVLFNIIKVTPSLWRYFGLFVQQVYFLAVLSLPVIIFSALAVGMVLALQGQYILTRFGAEEMVGLLSSLSLIRELAPVLASLLFIGRACSSITAELGLMKSTEQIDALELMAVDPYKYLFFPRFLAGVIVVPLINIIFIGAGIIGAYVVSVLGFGIDSGSFWVQIQSQVSWGDDILKSGVKALVFGFVAIWIAIVQGINANPSSAGVSSATTQTVVLGSLSVLLLDFVLTAIMFIG